MLLVYMLSCFHVNRHPFNGKWLVTSNADATYEDRPYEKCDKPCTGIFACVTYEIHWPMQASDCKHRPDLLRHHTKVTKPGFNFSCLFCV